jgi:uncharacterized repeat protein (TIGR03803 family)
VTIVPSGASLPAGTLLGTTPVGGAANRGTVFALVPPTGGGARWSLQTVTSFSGKYDLATPNGGVTVLSGGALAVAASAGGPYWTGGIDTLTPQSAASSRPDGSASSRTHINNWVECLVYFSAVLDVSPDDLPPEIHRFCITEVDDVARAPAPVLSRVGRRAAADVETGSPTGAPLPDGAGGLYVADVLTVPTGGAVLHLTPPAASNHVWAHAILFLFGQYAGDLTTLSGPVIMGTQGELYGAALFGGAYNKGGIYRLTPPAKAGRKWTEDIIWSFGATGDGAYPSGDLLLGPGGVITGVTTSGGTFSAGTVFQLAPPASGQTVWQETVLHNFTLGSSDGATPMGGLTSDSAGNLYGTTRDGGAHFDGTAYKLTKPSGHATAWTETILWNFTGGADGAVPQAKLVADSAGRLYGTTTLGGQAGAATDNALTFDCCGYGTVFQLRP